MKKLGHLGVYTLLVFLSVYLPELGVVHLTKFLGWGIDGYSIISLVWELVLVVLFVFWLKKKEMLYIFEKRAQISQDSFSFYLGWWQLVLFANWWTLFRYSITI